MESMSLVMAATATCAGLLLMAWCVYKYIPAILCCLFPNLAATRMLNPSDSAAVTPGEDVQRLAAELAGCGFVPLGVRAEKLPLWGRETRDLSLVSPRHKCFASISLSQFHTLHYFYTPLTNGGVALTASALFPSITGDGYRVTTLADASLAELLQAHGAAVADFERQGYRTWDDLSAAARVQATYQYYAAAPTRRHMRKMGAILTLIFGVVFAAGTICTGWGWSHWPHHAPVVPVTLPAERPAP